jgi:ABC-type sulfate transport system substrate-binding protein
MSLASKVVKCDRENKLVDAFNMMSLEMPAMKSDSQCPQNRIDFHNTFSLLIRMGNPERNQDKSNSCKRQVLPQPKLTQLSDNNQ